MICGPKLRRINCRGVKRTRDVICNRRYSYQMDAKPAESSIIRRNRPAVYRYVAEYSNPRESDTNHRYPMPDMSVSPVVLAITTKIQNHHITRAGRVTVTKSI